MIWCITTYFNPFDREVMLENYKVFSHHLRRQGAKLLVVEAAFNDRPFCLTDCEHDHLIQLRTKTLLWHREDMTNIAFKQLPVDCDKVVWVDSDILFENDDWLSMSEKALDDHLIIQPFSTAVRMDKGRMPSSYDIDSLRFGWSENQKMVSIMSNIYANVASPGLVWAFRRDLFPNGLYDRCIVGGFDKVLLNSVLGRFDVGRFSPLHDKHVREWMKLITKAVGGRYGHCPGTIYHLFHGRQSNRQYIRRHEMLRECNYNPLTDVELDEQGLLKWTSNNLSLRRMVQSFFMLRWSET